MNWNFIDTGTRTGAFNMRFDELLAKRVSKGTLAPTLRVFRWKPFCVSLGANQRLNEINCDEASRLGYDVVHRPTGGRAILHAEELTYSVAMPAHGRSILESHNDIGNALVKGLHYLGLRDAALAPTNASFQKLYKEPGAVACFASAARYEVTVHGKKIVGSAQRRYGDTLLQHGSILLGPTHARLLDLLPENFSATAREELREDLVNHTTTLNQELGRSVSPEELAECVKKGFAETFELSFTEMDVEELECEKDFSRTSY